MILKGECTISTKSVAQCDETGWENEIREFLIC